MSDTLLLEVLTPQRKILSTQVKEISFPTLHRGQYGILPGHTPIMVPLGDGLLSYQQDSEKKWLALFGGFAEVGPDRVNVLASSAFSPEALLGEELESEHLQLSKAMKESQPPEELERIQKKLSHCQIKLELLRKQG